MTFGETMHRHIASGMSAPQAMKATWKDVHAGRAQRPPHRRAGKRSTMGRFIRHGEKGKIDRRDDEGHFLRRNWSGFGAMNPRHRAWRRSGGGGKRGGLPWGMIALVGGGFLLLKSGGLGSLFGGTPTQAPAGMYWDPSTRTYRAIPATGIPAYAQQTIAALGGIQGIIGTIQGWFAAPTASSPVATAGAVPLDAMYADFLAAQPAIGAPTAWDSFWYQPPLVDVTDPLATGVMTPIDPLLWAYDPLVDPAWYNPDLYALAPAGGENMDWAWGV